MIDAVGIEGILRGRGVVVVGEVGMIVVGEVGVICEEIAGHARPIPIVEWGMLVGVIFGICNLLW